jgi:hypothetical protein
MAFQTKISSFKVIKIHFEVGECVCYSGNDPDTSQPEKHTSKITIFGGACYFENHYSKVNYKKAVIQISYGKNMEFNTSF